ncbi:MAG: MbtH family NRPS accessory protein [Gammaproteobacteria bacterium]|nr:MbtH family NRPS accessory protein [Gammaproteobacteria bacterium]
MTETATDELYRVVVNHEEQYSIWPAGRDMPLGWKAINESQSKQDCLNYIEEVWIDMRPLSLRKAMEAETKPVKKRKKKN